VGIRVHGVARGEGLADAAGGKRTDEREIEVAAAGGGGRGIAGGRRGYGEDAVREDAVVAAEDQETHGCSRVGSRGRRGRGG